jgi:hypothetical protein
MLNKKRIIAAARNSSNDSGVMAAEVFAPILEELDRLNNAVADLQRKVGALKKAAE